MHVYAYNIRIPRLGNGHFEKALNYILIFKNQLFAKCQKYPFLVSEEVCVLEKCIGLLAGGAVNHPFSGSASITLPFPLGGTKGTTCHRPLAHQNSPGALG